jgi:hypothetical protein
MESEMANVHSAEGEKVESGVVGKEVRKASIEAEKGASDVLMHRHSTSASARKSNCVGVSSHTRHGEPRSGRQARIVKHTR